MAWRPYWYDMSWRQRSTALSVVAAGLIGWYTLTYTPQIYTSAYWESRTSQTAQQARKEVLNASRKVGKEVDKAAGEIKQGAQRAANDLKAAGEQAKKDVGIPPGYGELPPPDPKLESRLQHANPPQQTTRVPAPAEAKSAPAAQNTAQPVQYNKFTLAPRSEIAQNYKLHSLGPVTIESVVHGKTAKHTYFLHGSKRYVNAPRYTFKTNDDFLNVLLPKPSAAQTAAGYSVELINHPKNSEREQGFISKKGVNYNDALEKVTARSFVALTKGEHIYASYGVPIYVQSTPLVSQADMTRNTREEPRI
jgi:hypothetical protein